MLLSKPEILKEIKKGRIKVEPFNEKNMGPISVDLTLGNEFGIQKKGTIRLENDIDFRKHFKSVKKKEITLKPGEFILGVTKETITLSDDIAGLLDGRSRFARLGLTVHATAHLVQPGVSNKQVFEIYNLGKSPLILKEGLKMGQICFFEVKGKSAYQGTFKHQHSIK